MQHFPCETNVNHRPKPYVCHWEDRKLNFLCNLRQNSSLEIEQMQIAWQQLLLELSVNTLLTQSFSVFFPHLLDSFCAKF